MPFRSHTRTGKQNDQQRDVTLASATLITRNQVRKATRPQSWQAEAWSLYDSIGELRFGAAWMANALSRCHLYIGEAEPEGGGDPPPAEAPDQLAVDLLADLHYGQLGQGTMLARMAKHLYVPGETFLIGMDPDPKIDGADAERRWLVASTQEFTQGGAANKPRVTLPDTGEQRDLNPDTATIIRVWNPHASVAWHADSSVHANLGPLREVQALSQHVTATVDSRLAGAGVLAIPHSASMAQPRTSDNNGDAAPLHDDAFIDGMTTAMLTAIQDRDDASAVVPIVIRVPDEAVGKIQHLTFSTPLDEKAATMRESALRRFARASDLPPEVFEGKGETSHWNAWEIGEDALVLHVEPMLGTICDALTQQYLWPALRAAGDEHPERWVIGFDSSELSQRPNRSSEAQALFDKGEISGEAMRRENGFTDEDAPDDAERQRRFAESIVVRQPGALPYLAPLLGFDTDAIGQFPPAPSGGGSRHLAPVPGEGTGDSRNEPPALPASASPDPAPAPTAGQQAQADAAVDADMHRWMLRAVEQAVVRSLELAGKRLVNNRDRSIRARVKGANGWELHTIAAPHGIDQDQVDRLLAGAFDTLDATMSDQPCIREAAETYVRGLLRSGRAHSRDELERVMTYSGCLSAA